MREALITVRDLAVGFKGKFILDGLDMDVWRGEIVGVVGGSGTGKSVLLRTIIGLNDKQRGTIKVFDKNIDNLNFLQKREIDRRWGVLFQQGALFSSLTVKQNIQMPLREYLRLPEDLLDDIAMAKIHLVGLKTDAADKLPSELSGGMIKRAALARSLALDPEIVFLDEPTAGLDPISAADFDNLILELRATLGLTVYMVTHDLDSLKTICDRIIALAEKKVIATGTIAELANGAHPWLKAYFGGIRARAAGFGDEHGH
jgi:phospholipid/cholesterol/gamma-HCH transport system ATP-binding protein